MTKSNKSPHYNFSNLVLAKDKNKKCCKNLASENHFNEVKGFINRFRQKLSIKTPGAQGLTVVDKLNGCVESENNLDFDYKDFVQKVKDSKLANKDMSMKEAK